MTDKADRIRVGDRVSIYPRGKKKIWCADFWRDGKHCRMSLETANKRACRSAGTAATQFTACGIPSKRSV